MDPQGIVIPIDELDAITLRAVIEEYVTRDGTELSNASDNVILIERRIRAGEAKIIFDLKSQSCTIQSS